jgi:hypothetical protein
MKKTVLLLSLIFMAVFCNAQFKNKVAVSFGGEVGIPIKKSYNRQNVAGFSAKLELPIANNLQFTFSPGYMSQGREKLIYDFCEGCTPPVNVSEDYISLKAGLRYYYIPNLYAEVEAGEALKIHAEVGNTFLYSIGLGGTIPLSLHNYIDLGLRLENRAKIRYQTENDFLNQFAIRIAYKYQF